MNLGLLLQKIGETGVSGSSPKLTNIAGPTSLTIGSGKKGVELKLSVSMRPELVELVRQEADASDRPVSRVIGEAVRTWAERKSQDTDNG